MYSRFQHFCKVEKIWERQVSHLCRFANCFKATITFCWSWAWRFLWKGLEIIPCCLYVRLPQGQSVAKTVFVQTFLLSIKRNRKERRGEPDQVFFWYNLWHLVPLICWSTRFTAWWGWNLIEKKSPRIAECRFGYLRVCSSIIYGQQNPKTEPLWEKSQNLDLWCSKKITSWK